MVELIAKPAVEGLPLGRGGLLLEACTPPALWLVVPFRGQEKAVEKALPRGAPRWPGTGRMSERGGLRLIWHAPREVLWAGALPPPEALSACAMLVEQSDGLVALRLSGRDVAGCLARLVPVDLREEALGPGRVARSLLGHLPALFLRGANGSVEIFLPRSLAREGCDEITRAMGRAEARAALGPG